MLVHGWFDAAPNAGPPRSGIFGLMAPSAGWGCRWSCAGRLGGPDGIKGAQDSNFDGGLLFGSLTCNKCISVPVDDCSGMDRVERMP